MNFEFNPNNIYDMNGKTSAAPAKKKKALQKVIPFTSLVSCPFVPVLSHFPLHFSVIQKNACAKIQ